MKIFKIDMAFKFTHFIQDGYELISEALNLLNNVYGAMHPEIAQVKSLYHEEKTFIKSVWCATAR